MSMYLTEVISHLPAARYRGGRPSQPMMINIDSITTDPLAVRPGVLFVATPEGRMRNPFQAHAAARRGAAAVVCEPRESRDVTTPAIEVADTRFAFDKLASLFHGDPAAKLYHFLVTGGERRMAAAYYLRQLMDGAGHRAALLGSRACFIDGRELPVPLAELNANEFHRLLASHLRAGGRACIFETPSEAVPASVPASVPIRVRLTERPGGAAALRNMRSSVKGTQVMITAGATRQVVTTQVVGMDNIAALAAAFDAALQAGANPLSLVETVPHIVPMPGVMQRVEWKGSFSVFVDFASTPEALGTALRELRLLTAGRLIVVTGVRPTLPSNTRVELGRAASLADYIVFTADDAAYESVPDLNRAAAGVCQPGSFAMEPDRAAAIHHAIGKAHAGDIVLLAGKGLSKSQGLEGAVIPWNDTHVASRFLSHPAPRHA
ncbi:MAG TPA: cyanophycin synthetase [Candidatus Limnocylindria bacterium]|jgi:UDP-N-acetylmuramyl tripeptide synthase|nr:cyanophycin synthetase [Candidatus Limnocylindria bacterium]